jgi:hypothetical protein
MTLQLYSYCWNLIFNIGYLVGLLINHLFVFFDFDFLVGYYSFLCIILVISLSVLCLAPCPVFVCGPPGSVPLVLDAGSCGCVAFIERRLSLLILFIIFYIWNTTSNGNNVTFFVMRREWCKVCVKSNMSVTPSIKPL